MFRTAITPSPNARSCRYRELWHRESTRTGHHRTGPRPCTGQYQALSPHAQRGTRQHPPRASDLVSLSTCLLGSRFAESGEKRYAIEKSASALRQVVDFIRELNCRKVSRS
ncbi:hypothetical protein L6452_19624 [Arctium lappa]|uniref:Uncharacterized protein n=1 Tax=Arctium lappa TaxID=4217 RepID=A0ACB9B8K3_ARCLA|nr:hypothetical protein L6452_19624 [Arctium lappa]